MKNPFIFTMLACALFSCAEDEPEVIVYQDNRLLELAEKVQTRLADAGHDLELNMNLVMTTPDSLDYYGGRADVSKNSILINESTYYNRDLTPLKLEALMLHEIGHFTYDLRHVDEKYDEDGRLQIMKQATYFWVNERNIDRVYSRFVDDIEQ